MEHYGLKTVYEELSGIFKRNHEDIRSTKDFAKVVLGVASVSIPLISAARSLAPGSGLLPEDWHNSVLLLVILGYTATIAICLWVLSPVKTIAPLSPKKEQFEAYYYGKSEAEILKEQIERYTHTIQNNTNVLISLVHRVRFAGLLLGLTTALILTII